MEENKKQPDQDNNSGADASYKTAEKIFINIADLKDPDDPQGRSYREVNREKTHKFNIGQLVELENGVRMFVVKQTRDCDQTPLYSLSPDKDDTEQQRENFANYGWHNGYSEEGMKAVL
jgi:hypothetical protein